MKKWCFLLLILLMNLYLEAQIVDTTIAGIRYSIYEDREAGETMTFQCRMTNTMDEVYSFFKTGFEKNKAKFYNSQNREVGDNYIHCGSIEKQPLAQDSSIMFEISPINHILFFDFVFPLKEKYILDSLFLFYWEIDTNAIGPIKYYPEEDLIQNLQNENRKIRIISSFALLNLGEKKKYLEFFNKKR